MGTYLKSHHLRKRFTHIAERTPMPTPDIDYLMGDTKQGVHCAEAYSYTIQDELADEYRKYILPLISIRDRIPTNSPMQSPAKDTSLPYPAIVESLKNRLDRAERTNEELLTVIDSLRTQINRLSAKF